MQFDFIRIRLTFLLFCLLLLQFAGCTRSPDVLWKFQTGAPVYSSPSVWQNFIIIGSDDHYLYALDAKTGAVQWKRNMGERVLSKPLIEGNILYVGTAAGNFVALEAPTGKIIWNYKAGAMIQYGACSDDDGIFFGSNDSHFYKLRKTDGQKLWDFQAKYWFGGYCRTYKNLVLTSSWDNYYYGLDRQTGAQVWKTFAHQFNYGGPEIAGDRVFYATHDKLYVIDAATGRILFHQKVGYLKDTVLLEGYLWTYDNGLVKRNLDGEPIAKVDLSYASDIQPAVGQGFLIVPVNNQLFGVSSQMKILWKWKAPDTFWMPGVIHDNVYYTGNRDSCVYALQLPS